MIVSLSIIVSINIDLFVSPFVPANGKLSLFHAFIFSNRNSLISVRRITIPSPCMFRLLHGYKAYTRIFHTSSSLPDCDPTRRARLMNSRPAVPVYSSHGLPQTQNPFFFPTRISAGLRGTHRARQETHRKTTAMSNANSRYVVSLNPDLFIPLT